MEASGKLCRGRRRSTNYPTRSSRKGSRLTTIRHGGPCGLQIEMRSAEREGKSVVFHAAGGRWYHAALSEGGYGMIRTRNAAKPRRYLCREASADGPDKLAYAGCRGSAREGCCQKALCGRRNGAIGQHSTAGAAGKGVSNVAEVRKPLHRGGGSPTLSVP